jgi:hypothetical protein
MFGNRCAVAKEASSRIWAYKKEFRFMFSLNRNCSHATLAFWSKLMLFAGESSAGVATHLYVDGCREVHPNSAGPVDATMVPLITVNAHRLEANQ